MCAEPCGSDLPIAGECPECGMPVDKDGDSTDICAHSPPDDECPVCGGNPCSQYC
jgi:hypothetical protein